MGSYFSVPEEQRPLSHREKRQRSPEVDNDAAANNAPKKRRVEELRSSSYDDLRNDFARAFDKMEKFVERKEKEYHWLLARTDHVGPTGEEREEIRKKKEELKQLTRKVVEVLELVEVLWEKDASISLRKSS